MRPLDVRVGAFPGQIASFPPLDGPQDVPSALHAALTDLRHRRIWAGGDPLPLVSPVPWMETAVDTLLNLIDRGVLAEAVKLDRYEDARDALVCGYAVVGGAHRMPGHQKDRYGFCVPGESHPNYAYYRGVSDNGRRPALVRQLFWGDALPAGPSRVRLPHGVWWDLPPGCFFLDAEYVDADELWAIR